MITEGSWCNCVAATHCTSWTLSSNTYICTSGPGAEIYLANGHSLVSTQVQLTCSVRSVLDVRVKRAVELSNDHRLVVYNLRFDKPTRSTQTYARVGGPAERSGRSWRKKDARKDLCRQRIVLVTRAPGIHSGRGGGVATVQSRCGFIFCCAMRTETTRCGD